MELTTVKSIVEHILRNNEETRDNDNLLIAKTWFYYLCKLKGKDVAKKMSMIDFFRVYSRESILPSAESIRRVRQKLQETVPELRGNAYITRHNLEEPKIRQQIKDWQ